MVGAVLHIDVDTFFCQVEQNRHPGLKGRPFAIQQHQDIIAVNYAARAAGVKKHMAPKEARTLLQPAGGIVHHVHMAAGGRVSYGPYRDVSKQLIARLRKFVGVGVIEKASIDEAYIQCMMEAQHSDTAPMTAMQQAAQLAETIRRTVLEELNLVVSIGIATNKMVAKLASLASKPDGIRVIDGPAALQQLLTNTPASRLPRCGGKVANTLSRAGVQTVADLQAWTAQQLQQDLGFAAEQAQQLSDWSHGRDKGLVAERPPPKTLSIQMTLTPIPLVMHPSMGRDIAVAGGKAGLLEPLPVNAPNFRERIDSLLAAMGADILGRVVDDKLDENRWPQKFELQMRAFRNSDRKSKTAVKSCAFPSPSLLIPVDSGSLCDVNTGSGSQLEAALLANAIKLSNVAAASLPADWNLVQVEMAATNFSALSAAATPSIHKFLQSPAQGLPVAKQTSVHIGQSGAAVSVLHHAVIQTCKESAVMHETATSSAEGHQDTGHGDVEHQCTSSHGGMPQAIVRAEPANNDQAANNMDVALFSEADIQQQQELFREHEARQRMSLRQSAPNAGNKRTRTSQHVVASVKTSRLGQQTISGLFKNVPPK